MSAREPDLSVKSTITQALILSKKNRHILNDSFEDKLSSIVAINSLFTSLYRTKLACPYKRLYTFNMVSKERYYQLKEAGLCTKCGKSRDGSPSKVRCLECNNKLKEQANRRSKERELLRQQQITSRKENSKKEKPAPIPAPIETAKKSILSKEADVKIRNCQLCEEPIRFNLICNKCLKTNAFTKEDAFIRYGSCCQKCNEKNSKSLKIVSSDIRQQMKHKDQELYKIVCYRRIVPLEYRLICHLCYWKENTAYIKEIRKIFEQSGVFDSSHMDEDDDIIDIS